MKIRFKRLFVMLLTLAMIITGFTRNEVAVQAATNAVVTTQKDDLVVNAGESKHIKLPVHATNEAVTYPSISISGGSNSPYIFTNPKITMADQEVGSIDLGSGRYLEFDVKAKDSAKIGEYPITISFTYTPNNTMDPQEKTINLVTTIKVEEEKAPSQLTINNLKVDNSYIGSETVLSFNVMNEGELTSKSVYLTIDYGTVMEERYSVKNIKIGDLKSGQSKDITLPVAILSTANPGKNTLTANFTYKTDDGTGLTSSYKMNVNLKANTSAPGVVVSNIKFDNSLTPGDNFSLSVILNNKGYSDAKDMVVNIDDSSITTDGILKNYYSDGITAHDLKESASETVKVPLTVSKYATGGLKALKLLITYTDTNGTNYTTHETVYVNVSAASTSTSPNIVISDVVQSPAQPVAGEKMSITFNVENKSSVNATDLKIYADGLTNDTFIPMDSDPYKYFDKLGAGKKQKVTLSFTVSNNIPEGMTNLTIKYTYTGGEGSSVIPIRNIRNDAGSSSIPKLIVSKYTTDVTELKAGSTFNLTYDIYNTNSSVAAKNITVTITQADNIFTVTQGSNSFFINRMDPGETNENTIEMKVKSDATTKAYPLTITIEYEFDGEKPNTETGEVGMKRTETLNLNAEENARPVVDGINVSSFNGSVMAGSSASLSFNFYNMGKAVLNNVSATVEGDGFTPTGGMLFIGNVDPGSSAYEEIEVIPNSEGTVSGTLKISYEDSNGETVEFTKDFQADVMPAAVVDPGVPGDGSGPVMNPDVVVAKKDIVPIWAFVLIQFAIFIIFVPVSRKVIISVYKKRLRKKEQEQY